MGYKSYDRAQRLAEFWANVTKGAADECWLWTGRGMGKGYGGCTPLTVNGERFAHRASYELHFGPIPEGMQVCHTCDTRRCINPRHFFLGTQTDNLRDMRTKGRWHRDRVTKCPRGHELVGMNLYVRKGDGALVCRACRRAQIAKYRKTPKGRENARRCESRRVRDWAAIYARERRTA